MKCAVRISIVIGVCVAMLCCRREYYIRSVCSQKAIFAHAGGVGNNSFVSNSLEAVETSISHNCRFIELDLALSSDSVLVALHDWAQFNADCCSQSDSVWSFQSFQNVRFSNGQHPIHYQIIDSIFSSKDCLVLVTDKISSFEIIDKYFNSFKDRLLIETFAYDDYLLLEREGYHPMISSVMPNKDILKILFTHWSLQDELGIVVSMERYETHKDIMNIISYIRPFYYALFSFRTIKDAETVFGQISNVKYAYVDDVS